MDLVAARLRGQDLRDCEGRGGLAGAAAQPLDGPEGRAVAIATRLEPPVDIVARELLRAPGHDLREGIRRGRRGSSTDPASRTEDPGLPRSGPAPELEG